PVLSSSSDLSCFVSLISFFVWVPISAFGLTTPVLSSSSDFSNLLSFIAFFVWVPISAFGLTTPVLSSGSFCVGTFFRESILPSTFVKKLSTITLSPLASTSNSGFGGFTDSTFESSVIRPSEYSLSDHFKKSAYVSVGA